MCNAPTRFVNVRIKPHASWQSCRYLLSTLKNANVWFCDSYGLATRYQKSEKNKVFNSRTPNAMVSQTFAFPA